MASSRAVSASRQRLALLAKDLRLLLLSLLDPRILLRGTLYELRTRCGKSACACAADDDQKRHRRWVLSYTVAGRKKMRVVPLDRLAQWRAWAANARDFRAKRAQVVEMTRQVLKDIDIIERGQRRDPDK